LGVC